jgi:subtilisin family serine protease
VTAATKALTRTLHTTYEHDCLLLFLAPAGQCLALFAPGSSITSTSWKGDTATSLMSGTSMATVRICVHAYSRCQHRGTTPAFGFV